ncbi:putative secreted protein (Por secretion system target) [Dysgonomonas alginatilytica]|uniref:Putative secreted protein (Por secretion system target) n=1 Tax=Dysgonomonas alginatilytica TaxID=1605892 RepID=A0A2V3PHN0_9BACT|nr:T9SS type A sorting domain-containing protein [Dysgonomonas alginatilytica]PXV58481.1 putative secreted protein (Por secretion system target) [Dysgonomonas alginatilytica]
MRKFILTTILAAICTISSYAQLYNIKALNVLHIDATTGQVINPASISNKGKIAFIYKYDGEEYPEEWATTYTLDGTTRAFRDIYEDDYLELANIMEVTPPVGYKKCIRKKVFYYDSDGKLLTNKTQVFGADEPITWNRSESKYFTVWIYSNPIAKEKEEFYFRFMGGGWDYSTAQPTASKITSVRVGEYYWMENNFNAWDPFTPASSHYSGYYKNYRPFTDQTMADYFKTIDASNPSEWKKLYNVTPEDINRDYGYYFEPWGAYRLHLYSIFSTDEQGTNLNHPNGAGTIQSQYRLPYYEDLRQLFAMCPFADPNDLQGTHTALNERDIRFTIGANNGLNKSAKNFSEDATTGSYWFVANNTYGLGYMPAGWRSQVLPDWFYNGIANPATEDNRWNLELGGLAQMFFTSYMPVGNKTYHGLQEDVVTLAEHVNSIPNTEYRNQSPKRTPLRWMRPLTNAELGYKLYIKIPGIESTAGWTTLRDQKDEIELLKAIRNGVINLNNITIDIKKQPHTDAAPAGYIELPKGYLRGFYVQYNIVRGLDKTANELAKYASNVEDEVLGYKAWWQNTTKSAAAIVAPSVEVAKNTVELYPNPVVDVLNIKSVSDIKSIRIIDVAGRLHMNLKETNSGNINIGHLAKGVYIISIETANGVENHRIIKN